MIVYVETNFVIEVVREQEQHADALAVIELAEKGQIELVFPNFVLAECFDNILRIHNERNDLHNSLKKTLGELKRSEPHKQVMVDLGPVISVLQDSQERELNLLHSMLDRLINVGKCLEVKVDGIKQAELYRKNLDLDPKDSIIFSTIIDDLKGRSVGEKKCFLSRDKRAFGRDDDRRIKAELEIYNCIYPGSFYGGLQFIQHQLQNN
ncbi:MAG TPA: PIN domain-containing protein [Ktedonobacteraceae bacterium]|nr:PIN domain-containing protein [Ktedonobacteraceae bacterium]